MKIMQRKLSLINLKCWRALRDRFANHQRAGIRARLFILAIFVLPTLVACSKNSSKPSITIDTQNPPMVVKDYFSDNIITAEIRNRIYRIPKNYFPIRDWENYSSTFQTKLEYATVHIFHPDYGGYTRELTALMYSAPNNAPRMYTEQIATQHLSNIIIVTTIFPLTRQEIEQPKPDPVSEYSKESWQDSEQRSRKTAGSMVEKNEYGLRCLSPATNPHHLNCKGLTHKGEILYFKCDRTWLDAQLGACGTAHYSAREGYAAYYEFTQNLLPHWRELNEAIFAKMKSWEQK